MSPLLSAAALQPPRILPSLVSSKVFPSCKESTGSRPARAGGKMHTTEMQNALRPSGDERCGYQDHLNPKIFLSVCPQLSVPALSPRPRPTCGMAMLGCEVGGGGQRRDAPINTMAAVSRALLSQRFSPRRVIWCRELCLTYLMLY